jgi:hypothetical protein
MEHYNVLHVKVLDPTNTDVVDYYHQLSERTEDQIGSDSGVDIVFPREYMVDADVDIVPKCGLGIACAFYPAGEVTTGAFDLCPRSSISNTPLSMVNSIGIIDAGYRGELMVPLRNHAKSPSNSKWIIPAMTRMFQILAPNRLPIKVVLVNTLPESERGTRGFGSTGSVGAKTV